MIPFWRQNTPKYHLFQLLKNTNLINVQYASENIDYSNVEHKKWIISRCYNLSVWVVVALKNEIFFKMEGYQRFI